MHITCISDSRSEISAAASIDYKEILCEKRKMASYIIPFACGILFSTHWDTKFGYARRIEDMRFKQGEAVRRTLIMGGSKGWLQRKVKTRGQSSFARSCTGFRPHAIDHKCNTDLQRIIGCETKFKIQHPSVGIPYPCMMSLKLGSKKEEAGGSRDKGKINGVTCRVRRYAVC